MAQKIAVCAPTLNAKPLTFRDALYLIIMFESPEFPKALDEQLFNSWLENGRLNRIGYHYLLIIWDEYESGYRPVYTENRDEIKQYKTDKTSFSRERLVAVYDLYSESRIF
jgi:hypothetical protein